MRTHLILLTVSLSERAEFHEDLTKLSMDERSFLSERAAHVLQADLHRQLRRGAVSVEPLQTRLATHQELDAELQESLQAVACQAKGGAR